MELVRCLYGSSCKAISNTKERLPTNNAEQKADTMQTERVSLDVTYEVTDIVEKVVDSVVGVTNLKRVRDPWSLCRNDERNGFWFGCYL